MNCSVTNALNNHQEKIRLLEESLGMFLDSIDDDLADIDRQITDLYRKARDYQGYDFTDEIKDILREMI